MKHYQNILYLMNPSAERTYGLKQALSMARNSSAPLHLLMLYPALPKELQAQQEAFEAFLSERMEASLKNAQEALGGEVVEPTREVMMADSSPVVTITRYVLRHEYDLLVKEAEDTGGESGFKALDMSLLRKCPSALYLARPISHPRENIRVAVAVDPITESEDARDLNIRLLQDSRSMADSCSGTLDIVSCWEYPYEEYLRHNPWLKVTEKELSDAVTNIENEHRTALDVLIADADIKGKKRVHHLRGEAAELLDKFVRDEKVDIMVMGTVARTGIAGFVIGNTAENVFEKLNCSLLALKPAGYVSPIKAYD
ncbi:MAG: universal stress protein [Campylobacterales bacterium]|nr:universal stress protein [Campylobacterales bacterium]